MDNRVLNVPEKRRRLYETSPMPTGGWHRAVSVICLLYCAIGFYSALEDWIALVRLDSGVFLSQWRPLLQMLERLLIAVLIVRAQRLSSPSSSR